MKKHIFAYILALAAVFIFVPAFNASAHIASAAWRAAYAEVLRNEQHSFTIGNTTYTKQFGLTDMDDDGSPELVIYDGYFASCSVYAHLDGSAQNVGEYGGGTSFWAWPHVDGIVAQHRDDDERFWTLRNGKMVQVPFTGSDILDCYDITEATISTYIVGVLPIEYPSIWAVEQVGAAMTLGLVPESMQFEYTKATTRAEFCMLAVMLYETVKGEEITGRKTFSDSNDVNVQKMAALGVVNGVGGDRFSPNTNLTREQAATMLSRLANAIGKPLTGYSPTFSDNASITSWAFDAVGEMQLAGIMSGVGANTFAAKNPYTREQSIVTMLRLYNIVSSTT